MRSRTFGVAFATAAWLLVLAAPVAAHGDHDARAIVHSVPVGPYTVSVWQIYPDFGTAMVPSVIVMFDGRSVVPAEAIVSVAVNGAPLELMRSATANNGWMTVQGVAEGDTVTVSVSDGTATWPMNPMVMPPPPTSLIPMRELIFLSIFLTAATAVWVARRTARAWRRRPADPVDRSALELSEGVPTA